MPNKEKTFSHPLANSPINKTKEKNIQIRRNYNIHTQPIANRLPHRLSKITMQKKMDIRFLAVNTPTTGLVFHKIPHTSTEQIPFRR
jgi:hypothetical protein